MRTLENDKIAKLHQKSLLCLNVIIKCIKKHHQFQILSRKKMINYKSNNFKSPCSSNSCSVWSYFRRSCYFLHWSSITKVCNRRCARHHYPGYVDILFADPKVTCTRPCEKNRDISVTLAVNYGI